MSTFPSLSQAQAAHPANLPGTPSWLAQNISTLNSTEQNNLYPGRLNYWKTVEVPEWLSKATVAEGTPGATMPAAPNFPTCAWYFADPADPTGLSYTSIQTLDPSLALPPLPSQVAGPAPGTLPGTSGLSSGANSFDTQVLGLLNAIWNKLNQA